MELEPLLKLQKDITQFRARGEKWLRVFWQVLGILGFLIILRVTIYPHTHPDSPAFMGLGNIALIAIGGTGALVIGALVAGDAIFFNKVYDWERELERLQSRMAAEILGLPAEAVVLRFAQAQSTFNLILARSYPESLSERIRVETRSCSLAFHLMAGNLPEAMALIRENRAEITGLYGSPAGGFK